MSSPRLLRRPFDWTFSGYEGGKAALKICGGHEGIRVSHGPCAPVHLNVRQAAKIVAYCVGAWRVQEETSCGRAKEYFVQRSCG